jgi:hypothetical protein
MWSNDYFCDSFLQRNLQRLKKDNDREKDKDMNQNRSRKTESLSFEFGIVFKDRANLLFSF